MWASGSVLAGGLAGDVVVDTGPLSIGTVSFTIFTWTTNAPVLIVEHRNALNTTTLHSQTYAPGDIAPGGYFFTVPLVLLLNERLRVILAEDISSYHKLQISIFSA